MVKCIIFDCDGTLVDSEVLINLGFQIKLRERGVEETVEALSQRYRGFKMADILADFKSRLGIDWDDAELKDYRRIVADLFERQLRPIDGVFDVLCTLKEKGVPMCVATNGPLEKMQLSLRVTGLAPFFAGNLFSAYMINAFKPDPKLFLYSAEQMGFTSSECLVVEDSMVGIEAAMRAGMPALLYDPLGLHAKVEHHQVAMFKDMKLLPALLHGARSRIVEEVA